jgi:hypothetical protein
MIVAHQVVGPYLRYILEDLTEEEILAIDREGDDANCSVTEYRFDPTKGREGKLPWSDTTSSRTSKSEAAQP